MTQQNHGITAATFLFTTSEAGAGSPTKSPHRPFSQMFKYTCDQNLQAQYPTEQTEPNIVQSPNNAVIAPLPNLQFNHELFLASQPKATKRRQRRG